MGLAARVKASSTDQNRQAQKKSPHLPAKVSGAFCGQIVDNRHGIEVPSTE
nr:MAG TPA: hypothetical protein [Bacteriophage sp.]